MRPAENPLSSPLAIAFFGTPEIAVPTLVRLVESRHEVVVAISQPDRRRGRGRKTSASPVSLAAEARGIPLLRTPEIGAQDCVETLQSYAPDLGIVVAFGQFLPKKIRELPKKGYLINAHASLLPRHRGAAPIAHAILCGDTRTGISVMRVEREMDAGAVMLTRAIEIGPEETAGSLSTRLGELAAEAIALAVEEISLGTASFAPQDASAATFAPKIGREDARLDWREDARALAHRVRAMAPSPGAFTLLEGEPLRILAAHATEDEQSGRAPGTVRASATGELAITTGKGFLVPEILQRPGGRALATADFLRGRTIADGALLTSE